MSKEAKLLFVSLFLLVFAVVLIYLDQHYECGVVEYQDLKGIHSKTECHEKPPANCWSKYKTENDAITACEGE
jgi:hypothetical protein